MHAAGQFGSRYSSVTIGNNSGVRVWPSSANFLLIRVPDGPAARAGLLERGVAVRAAGTFPGLTPHHLRIAIRTPADNERLVTALAEVL